MAPYQQTEPLELYETVLGGHGHGRSEPSLAPQPSAKQLVPNDSTEYHFSWPQTPMLQSSTSTLISAAWALVASHQINAENVKFLVRAPQWPPSVLQTVNEPNMKMTTVPLRVDTVGNQMVSDYLEAVQQQHTSMMQNQVEEDPKFLQLSQLQTLLVFQPSMDLLKQEFPTAPDDVSNQTSCHSLIIQLCYSTTNTSAIANFSSHIFPKPFIQKLLKRLESAVHQIAVAGIEHRLSAVSMVTSEDLDTIWRWNSLVPQRVDRCVHDIISDVVKAQPDAPAVCS